MRSSSPCHPTVVQTFLPSELHHEALLQVFRPHLHDLPIGLLRIKGTGSERKIWGALGMESRVLQHTRQVYH